MREKYEIVEIFGRIYDSKIDCVFFLLKMPKRNCKISWHFWW